MSVQLHPGILALDPDGTCYRIYSQLYHHFFNAQDKKDEAHPWGITEGDDTSIRLKNTAFGFAEAIEGAIGEGNGTGGGALLEYLKITGGNMTGTLRANYGFEAGIENTRLIETFCDQVFDENEQLVSKIFGVYIMGALHVGADSLYIGGKQLLSYQQQTGTALLISPNIEFGESNIRSLGEIVVGTDKENGIFISPSMLQVKGKTVYHAGNANLDSVNWSMYNGTVAGALTVGGITTLSDVFRALHGVELGYGNQVYLSVTSGKVQISHDLNFTGNCGILFNSKAVLKSVNSNIQLSASGGDLLLGNENTNKIRLFVNVTDIDGDYVLLSKYGAAYFPDSLTVRHNYGEVLLSSYRVDSGDEGLIVYKRLRFQDHGAFMYGKTNGIAFSSTIVREKNGDRQTIAHDTFWEYKASTSLYQPLDRFSNSLNISTDSDFFVFDKPVESKTHIGIDRSFTRLTDGCLSFNQAHYLLSTTDGIKHYGNAYFLADIGSERFSSGFAGSGWAIIQNKITGNVSATVDELTVRKKMRIYEMEVQKISAANGALWISDQCSGDLVEILN